MKNSNRFIDVAASLTNNIAKALVQAAAAFIFMSVIIFAAQEAYFRVAPASWFLSTQEMEVVPIASAGEAVPFRWCRNPRHGTIDAKAVRVFYRLDNESGNFEQVEGSQYEFPPNIENIKGCQNDLSIPVSRQPIEAGSYYFTTDLFWNEGGVPKTLQERSSVYKLEATADSLKIRILELEAEIQRLEIRLRNLNGSSAPIDPGV